jgi:signal transduction histidine kinase
MERSVREFSSTAAAAIRQHDRKDETVQRLLDIHASVVANVREIVTHSTTRATRIDDILAGRSQNLASESFGLLGSCFLLSLVCAGLTVRMAFNSIRRMEWQAAELTEVSWQMVRTQEEAARRFSHELHDELGQSLAAIKANLTGMRTEDFDHRRTDCIHLVDDAIGNVRELSQLLRPVMLDDFGLDAALRWLAEKFSERTGIQVDYESDLQGRLSDETETHLFRIAQEALTNAARHSGATRVRIALHQTRDNVELTITDNGRGLAVPQVQRSPSLGMVGMRARARQVGGELQISTPPGGGLAIAVEVPRVNRTDECNQESPSPAGG